MASSESAVYAIDPVTGLTLWEGTTPDRPRFPAQLLTRSYVLVIDRNHDREEGSDMAYFYDHRHASGVIPADGGARNIGPLDDVRLFLAVDGALLAQSGDTIIGWTQEKRSKD